VSDQLLIYGASGSGKTTVCGQFHDFMARVWHLGYETAQINSSPIAALNRMANGFVPQHLSHAGQRLSDQWMYSTGALSVEGLYMLSESLKHYFMKDRGMVNGGYTEADGSQMGMAQMQSYDMIKNQIIATITRMKGLQNVGILWTSHEGKGTDMQQAATLGPAMLPLKNLDKVPGFFAHCLRMESTPITNAQGGVEMAKVMYFEPHPDKSSGLLWPCKTSLTPMRNHNLRLKAQELSGGALNNGLLSRIVEGRIVGGLPDFLNFLYQPAVTVVMPSTPGQPLQPQGRLQ
jgi:hypothetical protein